MKDFRLLILVLISASFLSSCAPVGIDEESGNLAETVYEEETGNFANPERGFYYPYSWESSGAFSFKKSDFQAKRMQGYTLFLLEFWLVSFMDGDISQSYLTSIQNVLNAMRDVGAKAIIRFGYKHRSDTEEKPWDAELNIVLRHVEQLKPLLQKNSDVIHSLQAGFVGIWGEWSYTDHFVRDPKTDADYEPRRKLIMALLDALPATRQVCVRTPQFKIRMLRLRSTDTLTREEAYQDTPKARIGGHNDCFVSNASDYGTFIYDYERRFWNSDTKYTVMGGETCNASNSYSDCRNALKSLEAQHWTYLNRTYNTDVLSKWSSGKCFTEVQQRLGYRLVLRKSYITSKIRHNKPVHAVFNLENVGFAAPVNPRGIELIVINTETEEKAVIPVSDVDPRFWMAGEEHVFELQFTAPAAGHYALYLNLPDPEPRLHDNPLYSIRLANKGVWDAKTGFNKITEFDVN